MSDPGVEPDLGGSAQHDGEGRRRHEFGGTNLLGRRFVGVPAILWLAIAALVSMALPGNSLHGVLLGLTIFGLGCGVASLAAKLFPASRVGIIVGADGL